MCDANAFYGSRVSEYPASLLEKPFFYDSPRSKVCVSPEKPPLTVCSRIPPRLLFTAGKLETPFLPADGVVSAWTSFPTINLQHFFFQFVV